MFELWCMMALQLFIVFLSCDRIFGKINRQFIPALIHKIMPNVCTSSFESMKNNILRKQWIYRLFGECKFDFIFSFEQWFLRLICLNFEIIFARIWKARFMSIFKVWCQHNRINCTIKTFFLFVSNLFVSLSSFPRILLKIFRNVQKLY